MLPDEVVQGRPLCSACKAAGFEECNGPHMMDVKVETLPRGQTMVWHTHGKHVYPHPCEYCARFERFKASPTTPKPTARDRRLLILFGISVSEHAKIMEFQNGKCFICQKPPKKLALGTDHDHKKGVTRGLLCWPCNRAIAYLLDNADRAWRLHQYLIAPPASRALGFTPVARLGRSTRKWKTKREKHERMAFVNERIKELWPSRT